MERFVIRCLQAELLGEIGGAARPEAGGGVIALGQLGEREVMQRLRRGPLLGGGADFLRVAGGNVHDGHEVYLPALGGGAHGGNEGGGVGGVSHRDGSRGWLLDGGGPMLDRKSVVEGKKGDLRGR